MNHLQTSLERHKLAVEILTEVTELKQRIKDLQDNAVAAETDPQMPQSIKDLHREHYAKYISEYQDLVKSGLERYAEVVESIVKPIIDKP